MESQNCLFSNTVHPRLSGPRLSGPSIIRPKFQYKLHVVRSNVSGHHSKF